ncbi:MAG: single-stranded DNA-binding protein [Pirellulaceae bacterium]|nr:single-stranded DNA-binding protein [Pirellulaceae bacterium]
MLAGFLTKPPELRETKKGTAVCNFRIAVNRQYRDGNNEEKQEATFVDCEAWSNTGETIKKYLTRGSPILLDGRLKQDEWTDPDGEKRSRLKIVVQSFEFLGSGRNEKSTDADANAA